MARWLQTRAAAPAVAAAERGTGCAGSAGHGWRALGWPLPRWAASWLPQARPKRRAVEAVAGLRWCQGGRRALGCCWAAAPSRTRSLRSPTALRSRRMNG